MLLCFRFIRRGIALQLLLLVAANAWTNYVPSMSGPVILPPVEIAPTVFMPMMNVGHPNGNCTHGVGPGCAIEAENMTITWLTIGGRGIDTAMEYQNQKNIGAAINEAIERGIIPNRSAVFITTKISPNVIDKKSALDAVKIDIDQLNVSYIDLVLHHFPRDSDTENKAIWSGLVEAKAQGLVRSIGVSHYTIKNLESIASLNIGIPSVNQCKLYVGFHDDVTIDYCKSHNITYEAFSALHYVDFTRTEIQDIAVDHNVSVEQIALRWVSQYKGGCPIAVSPGLEKAYAEEDLRLGSFTLTDTEMDILTAISSTLVKSSHH
jgi:diketogulonate reductase-like aldo/keto reductase